MLKIADKRRGIKKEAKVGISEKARAINSKFKSRYGLSGLPLPKWARVSSFSGGLSNYLSRTSLASRTNKRASYSSTKVRWPSLLLSST